LRTGHPNTMMIPTRTMVTIQRCSMGFLEYLAFSALATAAFMVVGAMFITIAYGRNRL